MLVTVQLCSTFEYKNMCDLSSIRKPQFTWGQSAIPSPGYASPWSQTCTKQQHTQKCLFICFQNVYPAFQMHLHCSWQLRCTAHNLGTGREGPLFFILTPSCFRHWCDTEKGLSMRSKRTNRLIGEDLTAYHLYIMYL